MVTNLGSGGHKQWFTLRKSLLRSGQYSRNPVGLCEQTGVNHGEADSRHQTAQGARGVGRFSQYW